MENLYFIRMAHSMLTRAGKHIKSLVPNPLKYPFWYVFKSPQRQIGWFTLWNDLKGIFIICIRWFSPVRPLQPISICTGIYNRSDNYLNQFLPSICKSRHADLIELSVFDCGSTDVPDLESAIREQWKGKLVFHREPRSFTRSYSFNKAVQQSTHNIVFICDADLSLPSSVVQLCNNFVSEKSVWYPIYFFLFKNKPVAVSRHNGIWEQYGSRGQFAATRKAFLHVGAFDERFVVWGGEDTDLWERFHRNGYIVIRNRVRGFFHHWHQTLNKKFMYMND